MLPRGRFENRAGFGSELYIDSFAFGFVGPVPVRAMAFGGVCVAGATGLAALHPPFQDGSLAKVLDIRLATCGPSGTRSARRHEQIRLDT